LTLVELYEEGDDEKILQHLGHLQVKQPELAAGLHETLAGVYLRDRRLYRASQHLDAIPAARRTSQAMFLAANIAARQRRLDAALAGFNDLARTLPDDPLVARDQAQIASLLGDHVTAAAACERLLRAKPGDEHAQFQLARTRMLQGRLSDAERLLNGLLVRNARHGPAALNLGLLQLARGDAIAARESFVKARVIESRDSSPYVGEAAAALLSGSRTAARTAVAGAVKQNAADPLVGLVDVVTRGDSLTPLVAAGSVAVAASLYPDLEHEPLPAAIRLEIGSVAAAGRFAVAAVLLRMWSPRAALDWLAAESAAASAGPLTELTAIRALAVSGQAQAARRRATQLERGPLGRGLAGPAIQAAELAAGANDRASALSAMQRALAAAPRSPRLRMLSGDLWNALGHPGPAIDEYRIALKTWPTDPRLLNQLAATMAATGERTQYEEALRFAEAGLRQQPHYMTRAGLLDTRADLLFRLGRTSDAYAAYQELATTVGGITAPETWHRLGDLALSADDPVAARKAFEEALDYGRDYSQRARAIAQVAALPGGVPSEEAGTRPASSMNLAGRLLGGQRLHPGIELALVARRLVGVNDALADHGVDDGLGGLERGSGLGLVTGTDGVQDLLDRAAQPRAGGHVVRATPDGLLGALFCGLDVRHGIGLLLSRAAECGPASRSKEPRILATSAAEVKIPWVRYSSPRMTPTEIPA
jgi:tetratricopeptide (TPR) repeat protein